MRTLIMITEILATVLEGYVGIKFAGLLLESKYEKKRLNWIAIILSVCLSVIVSLLNKVSLFSYITLAFGVISISIVVRFLYKCKFAQSFMIISFYFMCLNYLDFFAIALVGTLLQEPEYSKVVVSTYGILRIRQLIICKALLVVAYLLAKRFIKGKFQNDSLKHYMILTLAGGIGVIYLMENTLNLVVVGYVDIVDWVVFGVMIAVSCALVFLYENNKHERDMIKFMEMRNDLLEENYRSLSEAYSANAKVYHDFNNHINILYQYLVKSDSERALEYLDGISEPIKVLLERTWTGNEVIDVIINSKLKKMQESGIHTNINVEFPNNSDIRSSDICTILGNLLDNAIEACQRNQRSENKWINITIRIVNAMLIFKIENGNEVIPQQSKNMRLITSKEDVRFHGWGLKSVETAIQKYEGIMQHSIKDNEFKVVVTLNYNIINK